MPHRNFFSRIAGSLLALAALEPAVGSDVVGLDDLDALTPRALVAAVESGNRNLAALAAAAEAAALRVDTAGALADPTLLYSFAPGTIDSDVGFRKMTELSQPLPWPGTRDLRRSVAESAAGAAAEDLELARLDAVAAAHAAYAEWHFLHRAIEINTASQALLAELGRSANARFAAGRGAQQDVLQAEVEHALVQERRLMLDRELRSLRARINALLTRAPAEPLPPPAEMPTLMGLPDVEAARAAAEQQHPHIRHVHHALAQAQAEERLAEKAFFPDFAVSVGYNDMWDETDMRTTLGVSINVPLGRDKRRAELDAARTGIARAEHVLADRHAEVLAMIEAAYAQAEQAFASIRLYDEHLLRLVQENLDAAVADYRSGAGLFLNVVAAERQKLTTEQGYERARADYWRARAELERAVGIPLARVAATAANAGARSENGAHVQNPLTKPEQAGHGQVKQ